MTDANALPAGAKVVDARVALEEYVLEAETVAKHLRNRNLYLAQENAEMKADLDTVRAEIAELRALLEPADAPEGEG